ncbi:hypothetical protein Dimus_018587 [Dionaea muscipula]
MAWMVIHDTATPITRTLVKYAGLKKRTEEIEGSMIEDINLIDKSKIVSKPTGAADYESGSAKRTKVEEIWSRDEHTEIACRVPLEGRRAPSRLSSAAGSDGSGMKMMHTVGCMLRLVGRRSLCVLRVFCGSSSERLRDDVGRLPSLSFAS